MVCSLDYTAFHRGSLLARVVPYDAIDLIVGAWFTAGALSRGLVADGVREALGSFAWVTTSGLPD